MALVKEFLQVSARMDMGVVPVINLDGTGLRMTWEVQRTRGSDPDQAVIKVINFGTSTRKSIHEAWKVFSNASGFLVALYIGWGGLTERIFAGDVWKFIPAERDGVDVVTTFMTGDGGETVRDAVIGKSFAKLGPGTIIRTIVLLPRSQGGLGVAYDPASEALILQRAAALPLKIFDNYIASGNTEDVLDELVGMMGLTWKIYNNKFIVLQRGNAATASPIAFLLSAQTGLLTWAQENDSNLRVEALANPNIQPGHQISVLDSFGVPVGALRHRVESITFQGDTNGQSTMSILARKSDLL